MPGTAGPNLGVTWGFSVGENGWGVSGFNPNFARLDTLVQLAVIDTLTAPPGTPTNGDRYIVGASATGDWSGEDDHIAVWLTTGTPGWYFYTPNEGWICWHEADGELVTWNGTAWVSLSGTFVLASPQPTAITWQSRQTFEHEVVGTYDSNGEARPASQTPAGWAITANYAGNNGVDFWNTFNTAGISYRFYQKLTSSTHAELLAIDGNATYAEIGLFEYAVTLGASAAGAWLDYGGTALWAINYNGQPNMSFVPPGSGGGIKIHGTTSGDLQIKVPAAAGTNVLTLPAGTTDFSATGGAGKSLRQLTAGGAITVESVKYSFGFSAPQTTSYTTDQVIGHHKASRAFTIPANFGAHLGDTSQAGGTANATGSTVITVERAVAATPNTFASIGTITIGAGGVAATFATVGGTAKNIAQGDVIRVRMPTTPDATFAGFYATLVGFEA